MRQYLVFGESETIDDLVEDQRRGVIKTLEYLSPSEILESNLNDICSKIEHRFRLDVPIIDRTRVTQLPSEEVDIDVRNDQHRDIRDRSKPFYLKGTAFRIAIPFSGKAKLFDYKKTIYTKPVYAEIQDDQLVLTHETLQPDPEKIRMDFDQRLDQIEKTLKTMEETAAEWNRQLPGLIRPSFEKRKEKLLRDQEISLGYPKAPANVSAPQPITNADRTTSASSYDLFLSHASEDKAEIAQPLYKALTDRGVKVWFDEAELTLGDSLRRKIDEGLARCSFGLVVISPDFFAKQWPQRELDGLVARENVSGEKVILPVWHKLDKQDVLKHSPTLADRVAAKSSEGIPAIVEKILHALRK